MLKLHQEREQEVMLQLHLEPELERIVQLHLEQELGGIAQLRLEQELEETILAIQELELIQQERERIDLLLLQELEVQLQERVLTRKLVIQDLTEQQLNLKREDLVRVLKNVPHQIAEVKKGLLLEHNKEEALSHKLDLHDQAQAINALVLQAEEEEDNI